MKHSKGIVLDRGSLEAVSKTFPEIIQNRKGAILKAMEKGTAAAIKKGLGHYFKSGTKMEEEFADQTVLAAKLYLTQYFPELVNRTEDRAGQLAEAISSELPGGLDLIQFCLSQSIDIKSPAVRLVDDRIFYEEAARYYKWNGTIIEAYRGSLFTPLDKRREFVVYLPGTKLVARSSLSLAIRAQRHQ